MITYVPATAEHAHRLAPRVRPEDAAELVASGYKTPLRGLLESLELSDVAFTVMLDGEPASMMGVVVPEIIGRSAMPWTITSDLINLFPLQHTRDARRIHELMLEEYGHLENYVDARYTKAIRWLRMIGYTVHEPEPIGPNRAPFCRFESHREGA